MRTLLVLIFSAFLAVPAMAAFYGQGMGQGGFNGPGTMTPEVTVQQVQRLADDSMVTMVGNIIAHVAGTDDKYIFRDGTGTIRVDIDLKRFLGQTVTPNNRVRIIGEVDKDFGKPVEIDVKMLEVLN